jgi:hypothetical protein
VGDGQGHERNRTEKSRGANRYLKRIRYGNNRPYLPQLSEVHPWPIPPGADEQDGSNDWFFEIVFDYGEHYTEDDQHQPSSVYVDDDKREWPARKDPFSTYRAGFEVRTYRLCRRVLVFHHFPDELGTRDYLVRATHFAITESGIASFITSVRQSSYKLRKDENGYQKKSLPPVEFEYSKATIDETVVEVEEDSLENLPMVWTVRATSG